MLTYYNAFFERYWAPHFENFKIEHETYITHINDKENASIIHNSSPKYTNSIPKTWVRHIFHIQNIQILLLNHGLDTYFTMSNWNLILNCIIFSQLCQ